MPRLISRIDYETSHKIEMKNHFVPCFYSKRWVGEDGKLVRYSRPHSKFVDRRKYPSEVGFTHDLYTLPGIEDETGNMLEDSFFRTVDQNACDILSKLEKYGLSSLDRHEREHWIIFLISLRQRNSEALQRIAQRASEAFNKDTANFEEHYNQRELHKNGISFEVFLENMRSSGWFDRTNKLLVQDAIYLPKTVAILSRFHWDILQCNNSSHEFLSSDRPLIMTNGLISEKGHIALPIGPKSLFVATQDLETMKRLRSVPRLYEIANDIVVRQAKEEVYSTDLRQAKFISRRFLK